MDDSSSSADMESLPDEILLRIFSNMRVDEIKQSVSHVNRRWSCISQDPSLNISIARKYDHDTYCDSDIYFSLMNEVTKGNLVRSIVLSKLWLQNVNDFLKAVANSCPALEILQVTQYADSILPETVELLVDKCPLLTELILHTECDVLHPLANLKFLKKLKFKRYMFFLEPVPHDPIRVIVNKCCSLRELHITKRVMTSDTVGCVVNAMQGRLESLGVRPQLCEEYYNYFKVCASSLVSLTIDLTTHEKCRYSRLLESLINLKHFKLISSAEFSMEDILRMFVTECPFNNLETLKLERFGQCDDEALEVMSERLGNLNTFVLYGGEFVTDHGLQILLEKNNNIKYLKLGMLEDSVKGSCIKNVLTKVESLKNIKIKYCSGISNDTIIELRKMKKSLSVVHRK